MVQSLSSTNSERNQISCVRVGSVDGICALKLARFNLAQRYAVAKGQPSSSSIISLILDTVNPLLLHHQPSSHQQREWLCKNVLLSPITFLSPSFYPTEWKPKILERPHTRCYSCGNMWILQLNVTTFASRKVDNFNFIFMHFFFSK